MAQEPVSESRSPIQTIDRYAMAFRTLRGGVCCLTRPLLGSRKAKTGATRLLQAGAADRSPEAHVVLPEGSGFSQSRISSAIGVSVPWSPSTQPARNAVL